MNALITDITHERGLLGAILLDADMVMPELETRSDSVIDWFVEHQHREVFRAISRLRDERSPVDLLTVSKEAAGQVDMAYLVECTDCAPTAVNWSYHATALEDLAKRRQLIKACRETAASAEDLDQPVAGLVDHHGGEVSRIQTQSATDAVPIKDAIRAALDVFEASVVNRGVTQGVQTGFRRLDKLTRGLKAGQLIVLAARPGCGKTSLAMSIAANAAMAGRSVGVFSLEMATAELAGRMICAVSGVSITDVEAGVINGEDQRSITLSGVRLSKAPLYIDDKGGLSLGQLSARARRMLHRNKVELLIVDYLQLLRGSNLKASRYETVTEISTGLKALARDLGIPIIALAQLSRSIEKEGNREPYLSDLRDSGSIEQDADLVGFLHQPDPESDLVNLHVRKHRSGPTGTIPLVFTKSTTAFRDHEEIPS